MESAKMYLGSVQKTGSQINSGLTILLILRGRVALKCPDLNRTLTDNHCAVLNHNDFFTLESNGPNVLLWINIPRNWLQTVCPQASERRYLCCSTASASASESLYDDLRHGITQAAMHYFRRETGYELLVQAQLLTVLHILLLHFVNEKQVSERKDDNKKIAPVLAFLRQNYREQISLEATARKFFISEAHLSRRFRKELGVTFSEYLTALRLESARQDIIYSDESITRIALNNGFASTRSMSQYFQRIFSCTPAQYRRESHSRPGSQEQLWLEPSQGDSLEMLARFVETYDTVGDTTAQVQTVVLPERGTPLNRPDLLLTVGDIQNITKNTIHAQLIQAQEAIGFQWIHLAHVFQVPTAYWTLLNQFDYLALFEEIIRLGFTPMIRIDPLEELDGIRLIMSLLLGRLGHAEIARWKFELDVSSGCSPELLKGTICLLREILPQIQLGFRVIPGGLPEWAKEEAGQRILEQCTNFLTTCADPNQETPPSDAATFERLHRQYYRHILMQVRGWMAECGISAPLYLMEWNTLTGHSIVEAGEFHRTALIADALMSLREDVSGFGVQLNIQSEEPVRADLLSYPLSLYLYRQIKRPLFSVLRGLNTLGGELLWEEKYAAVTRRKPGRYIVLLWHPCYIDPFQSLENLRQDRYQETVRLRLKGLEPGRYRIKRFLVDRENGSTYNSWLKIDLSAHMDQDVLDYLEQNSNPAVYLEERDVEEELDITQKLSLNAVSLWSIRKVGFC